MPPSRTSRSRPSRSRRYAWWLHGGTESCGSCFQMYAIQVERRCAGCDRGVCPHCIVVIASGEPRCCDCGETEEG